MAEQGQGDSHLARVALTSFIGTTIEWYDFILFGVAAATVFDKLFFPALSPTAGALASFATFGVAFVARPFGAVLFGHFGDRIGRKPIFILTLLIMCVGTLGTGLLPTYEAIGLWAPVLLVVTRLMQGVAVGGEWGGAVLMVVEHAPPSKRGFYGAWPQAGAYLALALSNGAFYLVGLLPEEQFLSWGWRIPFLASVVLFFVGLYARRHVLESPASRDVRESRRRFAVPLIQLLRTQKRSLIIGSASLGAANISFYVATVFILSYGPETVGISQNAVLSAIVVAALVAVPLNLLGAAISDRVGRKRLIVGGAIFTAVVAFPFFWLFDTGNPFLVGVALVLMVAVSSAVTYAPLSSFIAELFDARLRYTGAALSYHLAGSVLAGPAPFIAAALYSKAGSPWVIAVYIMVGCVITVVALLPVWQKSERLADVDHRGGGRR
ncbi:MFS transporter [Micromonospora sp. CPCC 206060]|uniref:MFS transporter n=1 Tax=Micromonospora sp. CPCC 206060 TaxID=3122406 RepID=UPI002FF2DA9E